MVELAMRRSGRRLLGARGPGSLMSALATLVSQLASSLTNLSLLVAVSRHGSPIDVGRISVVAIAYQVALGAVRALVGDVALVRESVVGRLDPGPMVRSALCVGAVEAVAIALVALIPGADSTEMLILAAGLPLLAVQDALRYISFAESAPSRAARGDVAWLVLFLLAVLILSGGDHSSTSILGAWIAAGVLSGAAIAPRVATTGLFARSRWIRQSGGIARWYLPDYVVVLATTAVPSLLVAWIGNVEELGGLRLGLSFIGPVSILWMAIANFATPVLVRRERPNVCVELFMSLFTTLAVVLWTTVGVLVPESVGRRVVGSTWSAARQWVPWLGIGYAILSSYSGAVVGLRVRNAARAVARARWTTAPITLLLPPILFAWVGPPGFGLGLACAGLLTSMLLWAALRSLTRVGLSHA